MKRNLFAMSAIALLSLLPLVSAHAQGDDDMVTICHVPPPVDETIEVNENAVDGHIEHGDYLGACTTPSVPEFGLVTAAVASISSIGGYLLIRKKI